MALSMLYIGLIMFLVARPLQRFIGRVVFGFDEGQQWITILAPIAIAISTSLALSVVPIELGRRRLQKLKES